jgi:hypothetical protein
LAKPAAVSAKPADNTISVAVAARLIMVTERRVQQLAASKWIPKPYTIVGTVQGYIRFLQDDAKKASRSAGKADADHERARKLKLANDETEWLTVRIEDALAALDAIVGPIKSDLAGVPSRVTDDLVQRRRIEDTMDVVLAELAGRFRKACADLSTGRDPLGAGAAIGPDAVDEGE